MLAANISLFVSHVARRRDGAIIYTLDQHQKCVQSVEITPDDKRIVTGSWDKTVNIWSMRDGRLVFSISLQSSVMSVAAHPSGKFVGIGCGNR